MKNGDFKDTGAGEIIKAAMKERGHSVRELSALTGISPSSISRITNCKQSASLRQLRVFSEHLGIPTERLLPGAGVNEPYDGANFMLDTIREILDYYNMDIGSVLADINKELAKYEQYAKTEEGKSKIVNEYKQKREACSGLIAERLDMMYRLFLSEETLENAKPVIGSGLLYFILSADTIPDYIFPIGYLDDAIAVRIILNRLGNDIFT